MVATARSEEKLREVYKSYLAHDENATKTGKALGMNESTVRRHVREFKERCLPFRDDVVELPNFPDDDVDAKTILDTMEKRFAKRQDHHRSLHWFPIKVKSDLPIGVCVFGDPHLGSNGCNVSLLRRDCKLISETPGAYGINIGDTVDNWGGRLVRLYAENDVSKATERKLAEWFLKDSGVKWLVWLDGNHDTMGSGFTDYMRAINGSIVPMIDWRARFRLVFPNGKECRWDAAHNHKGHSMWNELHGQERAAYMDEDADIYVAGHHHTWATKRKEMPNGAIANLARVRGYKWIDDHADRHGFNSQQNGASIMFVIRPKAKSAVEFVRMFEDIEDGCEYLKIIREKDGR